MFTFSRQRVKQDRCRRCQRLKYPGGKNSLENHKKLFCSDGVRIPTKKTLSSNVPDWPQPQGVYSEGGFFHTLKFLQTVRDIWTSLDDTEMYGSELNIEYDSFVKFFKARQLVIPDEHDKSRHIVLFKLHGLLDQYTLSPHIPELVVIHEGFKYLRIDSLSYTVTNASSLAGTPEESAPHGDVLGEFSTLLLLTEHS